jgi:predicted protein tyrosine phosphatase
MQEYYKICPKCRSRNIKIPPAGLDMKMTKQDYCADCGNIGNFPEMQDKFRKLLFICNANLQRSPTAEEIFKDRYETKSAGVGELARIPVSKELLEWADITFVMEDWMKDEIETRFSGKYAIISLDIPDIFVYMDEKLIVLLKDKVNKALKNRKL